MNKVEGLHHLAVTTADIKSQIDFFNDKLGMELVALYWMHGVENTFHGFMRLNDESAIAFVQNPDIGKIPVTIGETHAGNPGANCARGSMQHVALKVKDRAELLAMRDRLRSKGVPVMGPLDHGMCESIYFAGPENLALELSCSREPINQDAWIDPEVVGLLGIEEDELKRFKSSPDYADQGGAVPQAAVDGPGPHMTGYPPGAYEAVMGLSDEQYLHMVTNEPPVAV